MHIRDILFLRSSEFVCTKTTVSDVKFAIGLYTFKLFIFDLYLFTKMSRSSVVGIATFQGSNPVTGYRLFSSPKRPERLCGPPCLMFRIRFFSEDKLTIHLHLVLSLRMSGATNLLPLYAFRAWTRKTLPVCYVLHMKLKPNVPSFLKHNLSCKRD